MNSCGRDMQMDDMVLDVIRDSGDHYVSGEELCKRTGISRGAAWKRIEKLREEGYNIEASPHLGYRVCGIPDRLIPSEIRWKLGTKIMARDILSYEKIGSTNVCAYELAERGSKEGTVIFANEQTEGKARQGRSWQSPPGCGIYMSCILRPRIAPSEVPKITLIAAVAVTKAIRECTALEAMIKWPNDILVNGRKVCGILMEMKGEQDRVDFIILGIGINVNTDLKDLPIGGSSLKEESGFLSKADNISRVNLAKKILQTLEEYYDILKLKGSGSIIDEWKEYSAMVGSRVKVTLPGRAFDAYTHDIDPDGSLIVRLDSGLLEKISSGDVVMVR